RHGGRINSRKNANQPASGTKSMLPLILIVVAVIAGVFVFIVAMQRPDFCISRSGRTRAPAEAVFWFVDDFPPLGGGGAGEKIDPALKKTFEGASSGTGASYSWVGNNKVGQGRMTVVESRPAELVRIKLEFLKPFKATNTAEFSFKSEGRETEVTWSMFG